MSSFSKSMYDFINNSIEKQRFINIGATKFNSLLLSIDAFNSLYPELYILACLNIVIKRGRKGFELIIPFTSSDVTIFFKSELNLGVKIYIVYEFVPVNIC